MIYKIDKSINFRAFIIAFTLFSLMIISVNILFMRDKGYIYNPKGDPSLWIDSFRNEGIKTIAIVTNSNLYYTGARGYYFGEVENVYVNNLITSPDSVYRD